MSSDSSKRILLTTARSPITLALARQFRCAGHKVFVAETMRWHLCRFSNAVDKVFLVPSPRLNPKGFIDQLITIANDEQIDLIIPIYEEIIHLSKERHRFPAHCQIFAPSFELLNELHNKWLFTLKLQKLDIATPQTLLIKTEQDLQNLDPSSSYALKASYSRASLHLRKIVPKEPLPQIKIEPHNPWIAQEWLEGNQFCSYSICHQGIIKSHTVYPVGYTADGKGCIIFKAIAHNPIYHWIEKFVELTKFTGQIAFDFVDSPGGLFAIECNPRSTHGLLLFDEKDRIDTAFLNRAPSLVSPKIGTTIQLAIAMLLYGWRKSAHPSNSLRLFLEEFSSAKDTVFSRDDLFPFFAQPLVMAEIWMHSLKRKLSLPAGFMFDYEWNGEI